MPKARTPPQNIMMKNLTRRVRPKLKVVTMKKFVAAKEWFLNAVENHHVSEDIRSRSPSPLLGSSTATLFGFIGFQKGSEPIADLLNFLDENIKYQELAVTPKKSLYSVSIIFPKKSEMIAAGIVSPWDKSTPWVSAIEDGISGLPYYLHKKSNVSRSGEGFQIKNGSVRAMEFKGVKYLTPLIAQFKARLLLR